MRATISFKMLALDAGLSGHSAVTSFLKSTIEFYGILSCYERRSTLRFDISDLISLMLPSFYRNIFRRRRGGIIGG